MPNTHSTQEIIAMITNKDEKGLSILYDNYAPALNGIIYRIIRSETVAEEILQETFLKIWNQIHSYDKNKSTLFTWMSTIARNAAIDKRRLKSFENQNKTDSIDLAVHNNITTTTSSAAIDIEKLTVDIDKKYKEVLDLVYLQGYSQSETAKKLNIPLGTVKTRVRSAVKMLRAQLVKEKNLFLGIVLLIIVYYLFLQFSF